ncbi:hypothetical protein LTR95_004341 [Oleoguttula sp. CCFEE 5521]
MVPWQTVQSLLIFFGPWLVPRVLSTYRNIKSRPQSSLRPVSSKTQLALTVLFLSALAALLSTLPLLQHENIFRVTESRLQTPGGVLLTRLKALRSLTPTDERLRTIFDQGGLDARLLYARFGPDVLLNCNFGKPSERGAESAYLLYAVPALLIPHVLHLIALGITTSASICGAEGSRWRVQACIAGVLIAAAEIYVVANYDSTANQRSTRVSEIDFLAWKVPVFRGLAIAAFDGVLGWVIWLQATGRAFLAPPPIAEKLRDHGKVLDHLLAKTRSLGVVKNGIARDAELKGKVDAYWRKDAEVMRSVLEEPEVLQAQRAALRRIDPVQLDREAGGFVEGILSGVTLGANP